MKPLNKQAYDHVKSLILTNQLSYKDIYSETKLSKELGISRTPFRDAIHHLAQEGYIDIIPSRGFTLHQLTKKDVQETFQIRSALECYCTLEITKAYDSDAAFHLFVELDQLMEKMYNVLNTSQSISEFSTYDFDFHIKIIAFLENDQFSSIFETFIYRMQKLAELSLSHKGRMKDTYFEHLAILNAMKSGDIEHIYEITLQHMEIPKKINLEDL